MPKKSPVEKTRTYASVVYPESAPNDWINILKETHVKALISPLHDKDLNEGDGTPKKAHYHVFVTFDGPKTREQALSFFKTICGVGLERIESSRGYARYLCHLDNPEKHQYNMHDVVEVNGANYAAAIEDPGDRDRLISEMEDFCEKYDVLSLRQLSNWAKHNRPDWYHALTSNCAYYISKWLKSKAYDEVHGISLDIIDKDTGEVI